MRVIESFSSTRAWAAQVGPYPSPCVVEDEDGFRIFITPDENPMASWIRRATDLGSFMTISETPRGFSFDGNQFVPCEGYPAVWEASEIR